MALRLTSILSTNLIQRTTPALTVPLLHNVNLQSVRGINKHWNPKWKKFRRMKVLKVDLPKFRENPDDISEEEARSRMKEMGLQPMRPWTESPFFISSTGGIFEGYVPPEGDGKISPIHLQGAKQKLQFLEKKSKTMMAIRKIRAFEEDFDLTIFCKEAKQIYIDMHKCMTDNSKENFDENLIEYVTERVYPEVIHNIKNKTIRWNFIKDVELPRVVHARCTDVVTKENIFAQLTVRFHTQQSLAIYDRFGRLMHGSEILAKDVLEYVVFEKHVANTYGKWRVHAKIIPDWLPPKEPSLLTYVKPTEMLEEKAVEAEPETAVTKTAGEISPPASVAN